MVIFTPTTFALQLPAFTAEMNSHKLFYTYVDKSLIFGKEDSTDQVAGLITPAVSEYTIFLYSFEVIG